MRHCYTAKAFSDTDLVITAEYTRILKFQNRLGDTVAIGKQKMNEALIPYPTVSLKVAP